jgi:alpha-1,6-mannosyltransferase
LALPNLSDDFYRFIWDGRLLAAGYHPFAELPRYYIGHHANIPGIDQVIFNQLNSPDYFTVYPPVNQFVFWLSAKISPHSVLGSVVVIRALIILAEVTSLWLMRKILNHFNLGVKNILVYALNPLVIVELTGNLHFEAFLILFLLLSFWFLIRGKTWVSALQFGLAICSKLIPVILFPLLIARLGARKSIQFYLLAVAFSIILFLPLLNSEIVSGLRESLGYYFKRFEFNASIYYLVRAWGFENYGYNIIQTVGWKLALWCTMVILVCGFLEGSFKTPLNGKEPMGSEGRLAVDKELMSSVVFVLAIYFAFATVVHPWYVTTLVAFSVFGKFRFAIVWSGLIILTYAGYTKDSFAENLWLTTFEYVLVIGYLAYDLLPRRKINV